MTVKQHITRYRTTGTEAAVFADADKVGGASTVDAVPPALLACAFAVGGGGGEKSLTGKTGQGRESFGTVNPLQRPSRPGGQVRPASGGRPQSVGTHRLWITCG
ncbi:hypothetical protein AB0H57_06735 [Micromonospora sp. NPDC050686]|uniref:hypothetical protein n=1 Tax=Micromonospora sp. NPDC050686 TaxID=3154631 RepID=UPI0033EB6833